MLVTLTVTEGPHRGQVFQFHEHDTFIVGRSKDAHFRLPLKDKTLSRFHFMIEVNPPFCRLIDMASRNGTTVNGRKVSVINLEDGDKIIGGQSLLVLTIRTEKQQSEASTQVDDARDDVPVQPPAGSAETILDVGRESSAVVSPSREWSVPGYRLGRLLGRGGMGSVYRARRNSDGAIFAIKTIAPAIAQSDGAIARFLREASVLRQLEHPHIVRFERIGHSAGRLYFVMKYVRGLNAGELLTKRQRPLSIPIAVGLMCQALDALAFAHDLGFVHRDIKPQNVLIAQDGKRLLLELSDFGLARIYLTSPLSGLTLTGELGGTFGFMAPEQITDFRGVRPSADQHAAGALLYYLLTGERVYDLPSEIRGQLLMILQDDPIPIQERRADIPADLAAIVHRALSRTPADRFADVRAMRQALQPYVRPVSS
jgi:serine/threonine protein kinase